MIDFFADFSQNFSERALVVLKNSITISMTKIGTVEPVTLKKQCLFHADFNHDFKQDFNHDFLHSGTPLLEMIKLMYTEFDLLTDIISDWMLMITSEAISLRWVFSLLRPVAYNR